MHQWLPGINGNGTYCTGKGLVFHETREVVEEIEKSGQCLEVCPPIVAAVKKVTGNDMDEREQLSQILFCAERRKK